MPNVNYFRVGISLKVLKKVTAALRMSTLDESGGKVIHLLILSCALTVLACLND